MDQPQRTAPPYAIRSVDHALRLASMLQLEGALTVSEAAERLDVARSTAHLLMSMLVYRDFATQDAHRTYHPGPILELAAHTRSLTSQLRSVALPHLEALVRRVDESANMTIRTGALARFIASVECSQALRVGSREGMVFAAHETSGGRLLLAELASHELAALYEDSDAGPRPGTAAFGRLQVDLRRARRQGFAVNDGRSERGVSAIGVPIKDPEGMSIAAVSISMPSVRYVRTELPSWVARLTAVARAVEADLVN